MLSGTLASLGPRIYGVSAARRPLVSFMVDALEEAGCRIRFLSNQSEAPFGLTFDTSSGERMGVIAYAFTATRTETRNRPKDERSFQLKYGNKADDNLHELWRDPYGLWTTILVGIDPKEKFFVAADPAMHSPTKFFIRMEFKDEHADAIKKRHWFAWERSRRSNGGDASETMVGGTRRAFLHFLRFEREAVGLSPDDRRQLADKRKF